MIYVHAGSGKKYKKCCINKDEGVITTPADKYIEEALKGYPKKELMEFYDEEKIFIDEKLYRVLKHKTVPMWVKRDYLEETKRNLKIIEEAIELIHKKCNDDKITTLEELNNKVLIHYDFFEIMKGYLDLLDKRMGIEYENVQEKKINFLMWSAKAFDLPETYKRMYIENILDSYLQYDKYTYAKRTLDMFFERLPELNKFLCIKQSQMFIDKGEK